ncbi:MAG TPA: glycosyltransferase [Thermoanaerobaculia bacterium]|nr:glycosyltransferase [Thermoanaerobaculia bacterium]
MRIGLDLGTALPASDAPPPAVVELVAELMRQAGEEDEVVVFLPDAAGPIAWRIRDHKLRQVEAPFGAGRSAELWRALSFPAVERLSAGPNGPRVGALDVCHSLEPPLMPSRARRRVLTVPSLSELSGSLRRSLRRADRILVTSAALQGALLERLRASRPGKLEQLEARVSVVHPGIHPRFAEPPKASAIESLCGRHPFLERPYLLGVGPTGLHDPGAACLREAWARARRSAPRLPRLVLALPAPPSAEEIAGFLEPVSAGDEGPVILEAPEAELLPALYRGAELVLHPARDHRFGRPVAEAAAAGVPVVVGAECGVFEVLCEAAVPVTAEDPETWAQAIVALHRAPDERARRSQAGLEPARRTSWARTAAQLWEIYRGAGASDDLPLPAQGPVC